VPPASSGAEIYGPPRKKRTIKIKQNDRLKHTVRLRGDSDGELDIFRYLRNRPGRDRIVVKATLHLRRALRRAHAPLTSRRVTSGRVEMAQSAAA
jgi:hypothetical protein